MDIREKKQLKPEEKQKEQLAMSKSSLYDSLIFSKLKAIQARFTLQKQYEEIYERESIQAKIKMRLPFKIHGPYPIIYFFVWSASFVYGQFKRKKAYSLNAYLFNIVMIISINEYERYMNLMAVKQSSESQYDKYKEQSIMLMQAAKKKVNLWQIIGGLQIVDQSKWKNAFKARLIL